MTSRTSSLAVLALLTATIVRTVHVAAAEQFAVDPERQLPKPDGKAAENSKPVKVYLMLGQSNMLGFGRVGPKETKGTLEFMVKKQGKYPHLVDDAGNWTTRQDVRYVHVYPDGVHTRHVKLYTGLASRSLPFGSDREPPHVIHEFMEAMVLGKQGHKPQTASPNSFIGKA